MTRMPEKYRYWAIGRLIRLKRRNALRIGVMALVAATYLVGPLVQISYCSEGINVERTGIPDPVIGTVLKLRFEGVSSEQISKEELRSTKVTLVRSEEGWAAADSLADGLVLEHPTLDELVTSSPQLPMRASALQAILRALTKTYTSNGWAAVRVSIRRQDLALLQSAGGDGELVIHVEEGRVGEVRCLQAAAGTMKADPNEHLCQKVKENSPVKPGDGVHLRRLRDFVAKLNRHPVRKVEVSIASSEQSGCVDVDYLVARITRPVVYAGIDNTGTETTGKCRQQMGVISYNLTGADDIFRLHYLTGDFDDVHAVSYEYKRPGNILNDWRIRVYGDWRAYKADELGQINRRFSGESYSFGGEVERTIWQHHDFFLDAAMGLEHEREKVDNRFGFDEAGLTGIRKQTSFLLPTFSLRAQQHRLESQFDAELVLQTNLSDCANTAPKGSLGLDQLGRNDIDRNWSILRGRANHSFFLEPLFDEQWSNGDKNAMLAHELYWSVRGQATFDKKRLPPGYMQTLGGFYTVRGYPESFTAGDKALIGTLEYRYHWPRSFHPRPEAGEVFGRPFYWSPPYPLARPDWDLILRGFADIGRVTRNRADALVERNYTLVGAGLGVQLDVKQTIKLRADWAWALKDADNFDEVVDVGSSRVHLSLGVVF